MKAEAWRSLFKPGNMKGCQQHQKLRRSLPPVLDGKHSPCRSRVLLNTARKSPSLESPQAKSSPLALHQPWPPSILGSGRLCGAGAITSALSPETSRKSAPCGHCKAAKQTLTSGEDGRWRQWRAEWPPGLGGLDGQHVGDSRADTTVHWTIGGSKSSSRATEWTAPRVNPNAEADTG